MQVIAPEFLSPIMKVIQNAAQLRVT